MDLIKNEKNTLVLLDKLTNLLIFTPPNKPEDHREEILAIIQEILKKTNVENMMDAAIIKLIEESKQEFRKLMIIDEKDEGFHQLIDTDIKSLERCMDGEFLNQIDPLKRAQALSWVSSIAFNLKNHYRSAADITKAREKLVERLSKFLDKEQDIL